MTVLRIVPDFEMSAPKEAKAFYEDVLGLHAVMDQGWIITFASDAPARPQISIAAQGGAGAPVPDVSIEVDDVDDTYERAKAFGSEIVYDLRNEDWGVRRFFVRDPAGKVLNILSHIQKSEKSGT